MKKFFATTIAVIAVIGSIFFAYAEDDEFFNIDGNLSSFAPREFFSNGEEINLSSGNLMMQWKDAVIPGRSGMKLYLERSLNAGPTEITIQKFTGTFEGAVNHSEKVIYGMDPSNFRVSGRLENIAYTGKTITMPGLGAVKSGVVDKDAWISTSEITYDPEEAGWDVAWAPFRGVVVFTHVSPNSPERPRYVFLVKAGGALEAFNAKTGISASRNTGNVLLNDLITDKNGDIGDGWQDPFDGMNELMFSDGAGKKYKFARQYSDSLHYQARYVYRCGPFWNRHDCHDYYDDLKGWNVDAFLLGEYSDTFGNVIKTDVLSPSTGVLQSILLHHAGHDGNLGPPWRTVYRRLNADSEEWFSPFSGGYRTWTLYKDANGRFTRTVDPENNITTFEYDASSGFAVFPQIRKHGLDNLIDPTRFLQIRYPTGGIMRYEFFDDLHYGEGFVKNVIVTEISDTSSQRDIYQKCYGVVQTGDSGPDVQSAVRTNVTFEDGTRAVFVFDRVLNQLLLKQKTVTANGKNIVETYDWSVNRDANAVDGIGKITVERDGKQYVSKELGYDEIGRITLAKDASGNTVNFTYTLSPSEIPHGDDASATAFANISSQVNLASRIGRAVSGQAYDRVYYYGGVDFCGHEVKPNLIEKIVRVAGNTTATLNKFCYDSFGNVTSVMPGDEDSGAGELDIVYDSEGVYKISSSQGSNAVNYSYADDLLAFITYSNGSAINYSYDKTGRRTKTEYGSDYSVSHTYSLKNDTDTPNSITTVLHDGATGRDVTVQRGYNGLGLIVSESRNGVAKNYSYDPRMRLNGITLNDGRKIDIVYDGFGRMTETHLPGIEAIRYTYELVDRGLGLHDEVSTFVGNEPVAHRKSYDLLGNLISETRFANGAEEKTGYQYDSLGSIVSVISPSGLTISNEIDYGADTLTRNYAGGEKITVNEIDSLGGLKHLTVSDGSARAIETYFTYNGDHNLDNIDLPATEGLNLNDIDYLYGDAGTNAEGRIKEIKDYYGSTSFWYGGSGSIEGVRREIATLNESYRFNYTKDAFGNILGLHYPHGLVIHYIRDDQMRIKEVRKDSAAGLKMATLDYHPDGNLKEVQYTNGVVANYSYDLAGRVLRITVSKGEKYISDEQYSYDNRGRKTAVTHLDGSRVMYSYDGANRLTRADYYKNEEDVPYDFQEYRYDGDGNRTFYKDSSKELHYDAEANKLKRIYKEIGEVQEDLASFDYEFGNVVRERRYQNQNEVLEKTLKFDAGRQLTGVVVNDSKNNFHTQSQFSYDHMGRRESVTTEGGTTYYGYGEELDPLIEINDRGEVEKAHIYAGGRRLAVIEGDRIKIFHNDELGNTLNITDDAGTVTQTVRYDPFGNINFLNGPDENNFLFAGKPYDRATGLVYFGARYYDPLLGRYLSLDPLAQGTNHYTYTDNNPLVERDIFGLWFNGGFGGGIGGGMDGPVDLGGGDFGDGWQNPSSGFIPGIGMEGPVDNNPIGAFWGGFMCNAFLITLSGLTGISLPQIDLSAIATSALAGRTGDSMLRTYVDGRLPDECSVSDGVVYCKWVDTDNIYNSWLDIYNWATGHTYFYGTLEDYLNLTNPPKEDKIGSGDVFVTPPNNGLPPSFNGQNTFQAVSANTNPIAEPSHKFQPSAVVGGAQSQIPQAGLPGPPSLAETTQWIPPSEIPSRPHEVGGLTEQPDKPSSGVQEQHTQNNTDEAVNNSGDPVMLHSGELTQSATDLKIPGRGIDYEFRRTYRSRIIYNGPMGYNWDHNYNKLLVEMEGGNIARYDGDARFDVYIRNEDGTYTAPPGKFDVLTKLADGFKIRDSHGTVYLYGADGFIGSITDSNGNSLGFSYDQIGGGTRLTRVTDTTGRTINYEYDSHARLLKVTDFAGRSVNFSYGENSDLIEVSSPLTSKTTYTYSSGYPEDKSDLNHNLVSATDAKGQRYLYNEYSVFDRVVRQRFGSEGWFEFDYHQMLSVASCSSAEETAAAVSRTRVKDRSGNITVYDFNCQGNPLKVEEFTRSVRTDDPRSFVTAYTYTNDGLVASVTFPEGDQIEFTYENLAGVPADISKLSAGNIAQIKRIPDADRGGGAPLVTTFGYEPLYNKPVSITDPRGGDRFTTRIWYDYQEGKEEEEIAAILQLTSRTISDLYAGIGLKLGDLNGDGNTNQAGGNAVVMERPAAHDLDGTVQKLVRRFHYNNSGQLTKSDDEGGLIQEYSYDDNGYLARIISDPSLLAITRSVTRNAVGDVTSSTGANGKVTHYTVDDGGRIVEVSNALGFKTIYGYDANYKLSKMERQSPDGWATTLFEYNLLDRLTIRKDKISESRYLITEYQYDLNENLARVVEPEGTSTFFEYDERDLPYRITKGYNSKDAATSSLFYDGDKNLVRLIDPEGAQTLHNYDGFNRRITKQDALGGTIVAAYNPIGLVTQIRRFDSSSALLMERNYTYDEAGRVISLNEGGERSWFYKYNPQSKLIEARNPIGNITSYSYDIVGRLLGVTDPEDNQSIYTYDAAGNVLTENHRGETDNTISYEYDDMDRIVKKTDNAGNAWNYTYDPQDNLTRIRDPNGNATNFEYDALKRLTGKNEPIDGENTAITAFSWDDNSMIVSLADANGNVTKFVYDSLNRNTSLELPDGEIYSAEYDKNSRLKRYRSPNKYAVGFTYDAAGNLLLRNIAQNGASAGKDEMSYDGAGRMLEARSYDNGGALRGLSAFDYDLFGQVISEGVQGKSIINAYNLAGERTSLSYPGGNFVSVTRDTAGRIGAISESSFGNIAGVNYSGLLQKSLVSYENGTTGTFSYNDTQKLAALSWKTPQDEDIALHGLGYDNNGNIISDGVSNYDYDAAERLIRDSEYEYTYDKTHNFTKVKEIADGDEINYASNNLNQYTSVDSTDIFYDENGNIVQDGRFSYVYNWRNLITDVYDFESGGLVARYDYDALGRRVGRFNALTGEAVYYVYDGWQVIEETNGDGMSVEAYIYSGFDEPAAMIRDGNIYYYHYDYKGSIDAMSDASGRVVESYRYTSFGRVSIYDADGNNIEESLIGNPFYFTGQILDSETGLYNFRNRFYNPSLGRFMERDPLGYTDNVNLYTYAGNNPLNFIDPFGLEKVIRQNSYWGIWTGYPLYGPANLRSGSSWMDPTLGLINDVLNIPNAALSEMADILGQVDELAGKMGCDFQCLSVTSLAVPPAAVSLEGLSAIAGGRLTNVLGQVDAALGGTVRSILASERGALSIGRGGGYDIALGHTRAGLADFAKSVGAKSWTSWTKEGIVSHVDTYKFSGAFGKAAQGANNIHFNLDGIDDVKKAVELGQRGFSVGNMTNAELYTIFNDSRLLEKTIFYRNGEQILTPAYR